MLTERLEKKVEAYKPWNQRTIESNNFGSWTQPLVPNPGAAEQEADNSPPAAPERSRGRWTLAHVSTWAVIGTAGGPMIPYRWRDKMYKDEDEIAL